MKEDMGYLMDFTLLLARVDYPLLMRSYFIIQEKYR